MTRSSPDDPRIPRELPGSLPGNGVMNHYVYRVVPRRTGYRFVGETTMEYTDTDNTGVPMVPPWPATETTANSSRNPYGATSSPEYHGLPPAAC